MSAFWSTIFGNDNPVEIEIGPGTGTFLLSIGADHPERNYFAIEHSHSYAVRLEAAAGGLHNVRVIHADASCVVGTVIPAASAAAYHIYFPDPWWKRRHHRRRLFTPDFARALSRTLEPMGRIYVATDVAAAFALMRATLDATPALTELGNAPSPRTTVTSFERKGVAQGATIHQATFAKAAAASQRITIQTA